MGIVEHAGHTDIIIFGQRFTPGTQILVETDTPKEHPHRGLDGSEIPPTQVLIKSNGTFKHGIQCDGVAHIPTGNIFIEPGEWIETVEWHENTGKVGDGVNTPSVHGVSIQFGRFGHGCSPRRTTPGVHANSRLQFRLGFETRKSAIAATRSTAFVMVGSDPTARMRWLQE